MDFGGPIMHGLYSWNVSSRLLLREFANGEYARLREFGARFKSPVKPGETLVLEAWRMGIEENEWSEVRFETRVEGGKIALSNGRVLIKVVATAAGGSGETSKEKSVL